MTIEGHTLEGAQVHARAAHDDEGHGFQVELVLRRLSDSEALEETWFAWFKYRTDAEQFFAQLDKLGELIGTGQVTVNDV